MYDKFTSPCTSITCKLWDIVWVISKTIFSMSILFSLIIFTPTIMPLFRSLFCLFVWSEMAFINIKLVYNDFVFICIVGVCTTVHIVS